MYSQDKFAHLDVDFRRKPLNHPSLKRLQKRNAEQFKLEQTGRKKVTMIQDGVPVESANLSLRAKA